VNIVAATSRKFKGKPLYKAHPHLRDLEMEFEDIKVDEIDADLVFTATPHGASMKIVPELIKNGIKVIDLSGDYRFDNIDIYERWYGYKHSHPLNAVYGLPEINRDLIKNAQLVANPGCYPTGALLACLPIVSENIVDRIVIDSKSGVSGAGVNPSEASHYPNCSDSISPYAVTTHRHGPEISEKLNRFGSVEVSFTPHLVPVIRGIITTVHSFIKEDISSEYIQELYNDFYAGEPFVRILDPGEIPRMSSVRGSNYCHIGCFDIDDSDRLVIASSIDNLVKGASGQAVHNMNLMFGFNETESIDMVGLHP
ncbi:MAG: N-acetyl-gamma-glutamyl-phosphate reductase, partial [Methanobacterium sp.]|nr:N-acetyl-gamma-glutamyl-phosphate reductase [Methanobacterium sp.]